MVPCASACQTSRWTGEPAPPADFHPLAVSAEMLRISGRGNCKEAISSPGASSPAKKLPRIRRTRRRIRLKLERAAALSNSPELSRVFDSLRRRAWFGALRRLSYHAPAAPCLPHMARCPHAREPVAHQVGRAHCARSSSMSPALSATLISAQPSSLPKGTSAPFKRTALSAANGCAKRLSATSP